MDGKWSAGNLDIPPFYSDIDNSKGSMREWRYQVPRNFLAEKATDPLPNPVASFGGEGEKDALQLPGKCLWMNRTILA